MSLLLLFNKRITNQLITITDSIEIRFEFGDNTAYTNLKNIAEIRFIVNEPKIWRSIIPKTSRVSLLRMDTISLIELIRDTLAENRLDNIDVLLDFPDTDLSLPCISVGHRMTRDEFVELKEKNKILKRDYEIDIYARTKGERDSIAGILTDLYEKQYVTTDKRFNYIENVNYSSIAPIASRPCSEHKNYYYLEFWGHSTYGVIQHKVVKDIDNVSDGGFSVDIDLTLENDRVGSNIPIIDRYNSTTNIGYKLYINTAKSLVFVVGFGGTNIHTLSRSFTSYFGKRVLIHISNIASTSMSISTLNIDLNSVVATSTSTKIISSPTFFTDYVTLIGSFNIGTKTTIIPSLQAKMLLYGLKISTYDDISSKIGEFIAKDDTKDLIYLPCNEGKLRSVYDWKFNNFGRYEDKMTIVNGYNWINYYTAITKKGILYVHGLISIKIDSSKDMLTKEEWCYSNV